MAQPQATHVSQRLILGKYEKIFLLKTTRPRVLMFGMWHHLVNLCQVCSNNATGVKNGSNLGSHVLRRLI